MKAKYRPVARTPNTTSTYVEPARQADAFPGSSDFVQQLNVQKQHLQHVPPAMMHDASKPLMDQGAQGYQQGFQQQGQGFQQQGQGFQQQGQGFQQGYQQKGFQGYQQGFQQQGFQQGFQEAPLQQGLGQGFKSEGTAISHNEAPVMYQTEQRPAVLKERIIPIEEENIQPVVHRQIERREIHEVTQPIHEKQYLAPVIEEKQLPAESRQFGTYQPRVQTQHASTVEYATPEHFKRMNAPIIEETIRKTVVEEVQPVVHRETVAPHIIRETLPIYERVFEPAVILKETRPMMEAFAPPAMDKQMVPSAPELPTQTLPAAVPIQNWGQETKYVFEIQQKTKLIPQGQLPATGYTPLQK